MRICIRGCSPLPICHATPDAPAIPNRRRVLARAGDPCAPFCRRGFGVRDLYPSRRVRADRQIGFSLAMISKSLRGCQLDRGSN